VTAEKLRLLESSSTTPRTAIRIRPKSDESGPLFSAEVIVAAVDSQVFVTEVEVSLENLRVLESSLEIYFQKADCHKLFPSSKTLKARPDVLAESFQCYITEVLKIPGICIFQPFVEVFSLDLSRFRKPPPRS
jgi:hypothetical protein